MRFKVVDKERQVRLSLSAARSGKLTDEITAIPEQKEAFLGQMQKLVWKRNSARTAVIGRVG